MEEDFEVVCGSAYVCSDPFRIWYYKRVMCPLKMPHEWASCPFAHQSETAKRRDPRKHNCSLCQNMLKCVQDRECPKGDECPYAHTVFEQWLHPKKYRTMMCHMGASCSRRLCFFAHNPQELRLDTNQPPAPEPYELTYQGVLQQMHSYSQLMHTGQSASSYNKNSKSMNGCCDEAQSTCKLQQQPAAAGVDVDEGIECDAALYDTAVAEPTAVGPEPGYMQHRTGAAATASQPPFKPIYMWHTAQAAAAGAVATAQPAWTPQPVYLMPNAQAATAASRPPHPVLMGHVLPPMALAPPPPPPPAAAGRGAAPPPPFQHVCFGPTAVAAAAKGDGMPPGRMAAVAACRGCVMPFGVPFAVPVPPAAAAMYGSSHTSMPSSADAAKQQHPGAAVLVSDDSSEAACTRPSTNSCNSASATVDAADMTAAATTVGDEVGTNMSSSAWSSNSATDAHAADDLSSSSRPVCTACEECRNVSRMDGTLRTVMNELDVTKARAFKLESVATAAASKMTRAALDALAAMKVAAAVKHVTAEAAAIYDYGGDQQQAPAAAAQAMMHGPESEECAAVMLVVDSNGNAEDIDAGVASVYKCDSMVDIAAVHETAAVTASEESSAVSAVANGAEWMNGGATAAGLSVTCMMRPAQCGKQDAAAGRACSSSAGSTAGDPAGALSKLPVCAVALPDSQLLVVLPKVMRNRDVSTLVQAMMQSGRADDNQVPPPVRRI